MRRAILVGVALVIAIVAVASVAYGSEILGYADADCMSCHEVGTESIAQSKVDFSAENVDFVKCGACHAAIPVPSWDDHFHGYYSFCGSRCHGLIDEPTFSEPAGEAIEPLVRTSYGYFQSVDSLCAEATEIHEAHLGQGWVNITFQSIDPSCGSCHGAASCNACHTDPAHGGHGGTPSCTSAGCHLATAPQESPSCLGCHTEAHENITEAHTATASQECVDCHRSADLFELHADAAAGPCAVCHSTQLPDSAECVNCHAYSPVAENHYPADVHLAVTNAGCGNCHSLDLATEHAKYSASCSACHSGSFDAVVADWDKTCDGCHPTRHKDRDSGGGSGGGGGKQQAGRR
ncbi:MAG: hypothetical protein Q7W44_05210 [Coriobacteriia bacterium]|nr:hypothetical protein [Coriobacteriia bacterium]